MIPEVGRAIWTTMFSCAAASTTEEKRKCFFKMIDCLFECFPCDKCSLHFNYLKHRIKQSKYIEGHSNEECLAYVADLHNMIEFILVREGKKKTPKYYTWEDVKSKWLSDCDSCTLK